MGSSAYFRISALVIKRRWKCRLNFEINQSIPRRRIVEAGVTRRSLVVLLSAALYAGRLRLFWEMVSRLHRGFASKRNRSSFAPVRLHSPLTSATVNWQGRDRQLRDEIKSRLDVEKRRHQPVNIEETDGLAARDQTMRAECDRPRISAKIFASNSESRMDSDLYPDPLAKWVRRGA